MNMQLAVKGDLVWEPGSSALPWYLLIVALAALVVVIGRRAAWAARKPCAAEQG